MTLHLCVRIGGKDRHDSKAGFSRLRLQQYIMQQVSQGRTDPKVWFGVRFVDGQTGRGIPLVELETVHRAVYVSDSNGWVAIADPGAMGREVFFHVRGHGYGVAADGFGYRGVRLQVEPGKRTVVRLQRTNIAERVCRLTGEGIYADSVLLGEKAPLQNPVGTGKVWGQDSALAVQYRGRMLWFWGDTNKPDYPLGNFRTTGAVATLPKGSRTAEQGLDFRYFTDKSGFARAIVPSNEPGPIWVFGVTVINGKMGPELWAHYSRMKDLGTVLAHGLVRWDEASETFRIVRDLPLKETWRFLEGHPLAVTENGIEYRASGNNFPLVRVRANPDDFVNPGAYQAYMCLNERGEVVRSSDGTPAYQWQAELPPITPDREAELIKAGKLKAEEARFLPRDERGEPVILHAGSVTYNPWRKRYLVIATRKGGKDSLLGEIWYSESEQPTGPWKRAVKITTHEKYTFYNPVHHPFLDTEGGRVIYFEGTYTEQFSGNARPTPRYDYNQILYRLDLSDPRLNTAR